jgi:hypothetical protein
MVRLKAQLFPAVVVYFLAITYPMLPPPQQPAQISGLVDLPHSMSARQLAPLPPVMTAVSQELSNQATLLAVI